MATGYTNPVKEGEITELKDFVLRCARAFGALIEMRDDPMDSSIPEDLPVSDDGYGNLVEQTEARLRELRAMTPEAQEAATESYNLARRESWLRQVQQDNLIRDRYTAMLKKVNDWKAPEDHAKLKNFMIDQLTQSLEWDCASEGTAPPKKATVDEWFLQELERQMQILVSFKKYRDEAIQRSTERRDWLRELRRSLPNG